MKKVQKILKIRYKKKKKINEIHIAAKHMGCFKMTEKKLDISLDLNFALTVRFNISEK